MRTLLRLSILVLGILVIAGCYYYDDDYLRNPGRYGQPQQQPRDPGRRFPPPPADQPGPSTWPAPQPPPAPLPPNSVKEPAPLPEENPPQDTGEAPGDFNLQLRLVGVSPEAKEKLEQDIRAVEGVESVAPIAYEGGELRLGLKYDGSIRSLQNELEVLCRFRVRRFLIELATQVQPKKNLKVRIFAPAEGSRLSSTEVFVGVEVEGCENPMVTVNGIPAEPLPAPGQYRARILCEKGENEIRAVARDDAGNNASAVRRIVVSDESTGLDDTTLSVLIQGKVNDPLSTVTVDGRPVKVNPDGTYRVEVPLKEGLRKIPVGGK
ncbi:MAG: hypothetical protein ACYTHM_21290 [Planctomycetota bacterium]